MQPWHIAVLLVVLLVVFGASKLPDLARNLGKSAKILKQEIRELSDDPADSKQTPKQESTAPEASKTDPSDSGQNTPVGKGDQ